MVPCRRRLRGAGPVRVLVAPGALGMGRQQLPVGLVMDGRSVVVMVRAAASFRIWRLRLFIEVYKDGHGECGGRECSWRAGKGDVREESRQDARNGWVGGEEKKGRREKTRALSDYEETSPLSGTPGHVREILQL